MDSGLGLSMLALFKKGKAKANVENSIVVVGIKKALLLGLLSRDRDEEGETDDDITSLVSSVTDTEGDKQNRHSSDICSSSVQGNESSDDSGVTSYSGGGRTGVRGSVLKKKINTFVSPTQHFNRLDTDECSTDQGVALSISESKSSRKVVKPVWNSPRHGQITRQNAVKENSLDSNTDTELLSSQTNDVDRRKSISWSMDANHKNSSQRSSSSSTSRQDQKLKNNVRHHNFNSLTVPSPNTIPSPTHVLSTIPVPTPYSVPISNHFPFAPNYILVSPSQCSRLPSNNWLSPTPTRQSLDTTRRKSSSNISTHLLGPNPDDRRLSFNSLEPVNIIPNTIDMRRLSGTCGTSIETRELDSHILSRQSTIEQQLYSPRLGDMRKHEVMRALSSPVQARRLGSLHQDPRRLSFSSAETKSPKTTHSRGTSPIQALASTKTRYRRKNSVEKETNSSTSSSQTSLVSPSSLPLPTGVYHQDTKQAVLSSSKQHQSIFSPLKGRQQTTNTLRKMESSSTTTYTKRPNNLSLPREDLTSTSEITLLNKYSSLPVASHSSSMRTRTSSPFKHLGAHLHSNPENGSAKNSSQRIETYESSTAHYSPQGGSQLELSSWNKGLHTPVERSSSKLTLIVTDL
ncbi:uncharacterized protein LOC111714245 isoform X2 [Eurytemora carolleeae]|uniref:uncharacterized protein LOC111714245 isoform X2 n=1 Tax=Eurytemora carolleeae TaxID=1294199 RepID=UPI000C75A26C|nr:uncharacterized protein LOC111714245 isoform X2 [Eurytemora carolleeae]|eukprot:XP_023345076.1 uncharacterized protein LOC111714245 isoform X2 [Eurytemora affinis]